MSGGIGRIDQKVVHVNDKPSFCYHIMERVIHELLEGSRGIGKAKEYNGWFEESLVSNEGNFPLVSIFDTDIKLFWFGFFYGGSQFSSGGKTSDYWGIVWKELRSLFNDSIDSMVVKGIVDILRFCFLVWVGTKVIFLNHVDVDVFGQLRSGLVIKGVSAV